MVERDGVQGRPPTGLMFVVLLQGVNMKGRIANRKIVLEYRSGYMRIIESLIALFPALAFSVSTSSGEPNDAFFSPSYSRSVSVSYPLVHPVVDFYFTSNV